MKKVGMICLIVSMALVVASQGFAKDEHGKRKEKRHSSSEDSGAHKEHGDWKADKFTNEERERIHGYVQRYGAHSGKHSRELPPGLAKKKDRGRKLPPAWEDKCVPGQILPVAVFEQCRPLPRELVVQLPPPPPATITVAIDGRVLRVIEATREILDVFNVHLPF